MARLSAGNADGAKEELGSVIEAGEPEVAKLRAKGAKDAFSHPEAQPYIRAAHALGCLAYDENRFEDAAKDLERVHSIDEGIGRRRGAADCGQVADEAGQTGRRGGAAGAGDQAGNRRGPRTARAGAGALRRGRRGQSEDRARGGAWTATPHYGKALLGRIRRRVENVAAAQPGSMEEALLYAQTYGDVWTDAAKTFLEGVVDEKPAKKEQRRRPR